MTDPSTATDAATYPEIDAASTGAKTVYLIRHAHSLENQRISSMFSCFGDLSRFSMPKKEDVGASLELLKLEHDAPLSDHGLKQCELMKALLRENSFVENSKIELVVHSPLQRAKQTCEELVGCSSEETLDPPIKNGKSISESFRQSFAASATTTTTTATTKTEEKPYPKPIQRVVGLCLLEEKHQLEWVPGNTAGFEKRVVEFQQWLGQQPESVVCVVGHSQYFKRMLELPFKFDNTDVYKVSFDPQKTTPNKSFVMEHEGKSHEITLKPEWYDLKLLHTCREGAKTDAASETATAATTTVEATASAVGQAADERDKNES